MSYTKQVWEDLPSLNTPITADRLNHMEDGIAANDTAITDINTDIGDMESLVGGNTLVEAINNVWDRIYPIGSIYISVSSTSPQTLFGGTWEQITGDAYLKIVTENAGTLAGTSSKHKIPLTSIPAHHHSVPRVAQYGNSGSTANLTSGNAWQGISSVDTSDAGGGQAYYPYYLGVYVWKRTA